ncbi:hypothetical protein AB0L71_27580 [Streptomyces sp. NPDC052052]|uniref:hypothetical protein n=1 Tax=Streptomyces sp. NPDC052052 TaxID=3154756 RepID=UPI003434E070
MTTCLQRLLVAAASSALLALAGIPVPASASPSPTTAAASAAADENTPPSAVEDFANPDAANVLATKYIEIIKGDGHILLTDCADTAPHIKAQVVLTPADQEAGEPNADCFQASAKTGYLTMEVPRVFAIETADHPASADLSANGTTQTVDGAKDTLESVGEGTVGGARSVLMEIRVTG